MVYLADEGRYETMKYFREGKNLDEQHFNQESLRNSISGGWIKNFSGSSLAKRAKEGRCKNSSLV